MSKAEKCEMISSYADCLCDTLSAKLGLDMESFDKYIETTRENGIVDKRLDDYVSNMYKYNDDDFYEELQMLDIVYIERNVANLVPLSYCKNLKFVVFDGYWIEKNKFNDFSPIKDIPNVYIWHNPGDRNVKNSFLDYTNIGSFKNIRYSEAADDPWADLIDALERYKIE